VSFEFVKDCAELAASKCLKNVLVTNGYINSEPAAELLPFIHALNIDIKSMDDDFYRTKCHGSLQPVLDFAVQAVNAGCHVEITNLIIPTLNDDNELMEELAKWIRSNLGRKTPLHLSAYRPQYKMDIPPTAAGTLDRSHRICSRHLDYVYLGNVLTSIGRDTMCPACKTTMISRQGYSTRIAGITEGECAKCRRPADVILE
jgi:pyruvate formate lyase activating enzyme